jgi:hypothetical protein
VASDDQAVNGSLADPERWIYIERVGRNYHKIMPDEYDVEFHGDLHGPRISYNQGGK